MRAASPPAVFTGEQVVLRDAASRLRRARHALLMGASEYNGIPAYDVMYQTVTMLQRQARELAAAPHPSEYTSLFRALDKWHIRRDIRTGHITVPAFMGLEPLVQAFAHVPQSKQRRGNYRLQVVRSTAHELTGTFTGLFDGSYAPSAASLIGVPYQRVAEKHFAALCEAYAVLPRNP